MRFVPGKLRGFRLLVGAYAVTSYGSYLDMIALNLFSYEQTGRAWDLGLLMFVRLLSGAVAGLSAGRLIARMSRKPTMVWSSLGQAIGLALLVFVPVAARMEFLFVMAMVGGAGNALFVVALRGVVPGIVGQDRRNQANSLLATARSLAMVVGFASAGPVVSSLGYSAAFLIDAASFVACAAVVASLATARYEDPPPTTEAHPGHSRLPGWIGVPLVTMIGIRMVDAFGSSSHNLALPVYSDSADRADPTAFAGWFLAAWAVGNIIVQQAIRVYGNHRGRNVGVPGFVAGTVLMSSAFILGFAGFPMFLTMLIALVAGTADGLTEVSYVNHLQMLPGRARDGAFGLSAMAENLGFGFGMIISSFLLERYTPFAVVAVSHSVPILVSLLFCVGFAWKTKRTGGGTIEYMAAPHSNHRDGAEVSGR